MVWPAQVRQICDAGVHEARQGFHTKSGKANTGTGTDTVTHTNTDTAANTGANSGTNSDANAGTNATNATASNPVAGSRFMPLRRGANRVHYPVQTHWKLPWAIQEDHQGWVDQACLERILRPKSGRHSLQLIQQPVATEQTWAMGR